MTAVHDRPVKRDGAHITVVEFEELVSGAPEKVFLELLNGRVGVKAVPDGDHSEMILWLQTQCMQHRPDLGLYAEAGLKVETYRQGRARPDGTLAARGTFAGKGEWAGVDGVLMTVEVTSFDGDSDRRDREEKPRAYAESGIPIYLLIDRETAEITVHAEPVKGRYTDVHTVALGKVCHLPAPVDITLETEGLKDYIR